MLCFPLVKAGWGVSGLIPGMIWVDVSVSSRTSSIVGLSERALGALASLPSDMSIGPFSIAEKLRAEQQPLFPGNVETSLARSLRVAWYVREAGVFHAVKRKE